MSVRQAGAAIFRRLPPGARRSVLHKLGKHAPWEEGFDFTPPELAPGEIAGPPDFVGIGAQKAGTTWWYSLVVAHPGVWSRPDLHKERHFLSRFGTVPFGSEEVSDYHRWFPRAPGKLTGEWTPDYMNYPWVPRALQMAAPDVRLLVMLRDPVERFCSGLAHLWRNGGVLDAASVAEAMHRGFYHAAMSGWWERFRAEQILVLQYEHCVSDPEGALAATYRFLGLDDSFVPSDAARRVNSSGEEKITIDDDVRAALVDVYSPDVSALAKRLPEMDLGLWANFSGARVG
jgi:hypothetical protein